jgi:hypothetical protein
MGSEGADLYRRCWRQGCTNDPEARQALAVGGTTSCYRCSIFLIGAAGNDLQRVVRQRPLQSLGFVSRRSHPDVALFLGGKNHRHGLRMDRFDDRVRRRCQEAKDVVRPWDRLRLGATVTLELGPDAGEGEQRAVVIVGNSIRLASEVESGDALS